MALLADEEVIAGRKDLVAAARKTLTPCCPPCPTGVW